MAHAICYELAYEQPDVIVDRRCDQTGQSVDGKSSRSRSILPALKLEAPSMGRSGAIPDEAHTALSRGASHG
jgi:hypothetical protein